MKWKSPELASQRAKVARAVRQSDTALMCLDSADLGSPSMEAYFAALNDEEVAQKEHQALRDATMLLIAEQEDPVTS